MTRTDIHRPSAIQPADYSFVGYGYRGSDIGDAACIMVERKRIEAHMQRTGGSYSTHEHGGSCHICGAHFIYSAVFYHRDTNSYIRTGLDCAEKMHMADSTLFQKQCRAALEASKGKRNAKATLEAASLSAAWDVYLAGPTDRYEERTISDIVGKLVRYGSASDRQLAFVGSLLREIESRNKPRPAPIVAPERPAPVAAPERPAVPVSSDRRSITGRVVSIKLAESAYAYANAYKMLIETAAGWRVYGSVPQSLLDAGIERGHTVTFSAAVKRSDKDPAFGFFSRPTLAHIVTNAVEAAPLEAAPVAAPVPALVSAPVSDYDRIREIHASDPARFAAMVRDGDPVACRYQRAASDEDLEIMGELYAADPDRFTRLCDRGSFAALAYRDALRD